ncbi:farnesol dehydrogenase-like [Phlebotomus argentipes]|uniref:farnesol dehydrogenase-like n=1 Tax=Phlebotomus argentipes TaxID=94469 RepID=UPI002892F939|nr:farnesol dehydrogenase-like [Phlebotomus argentipes]
MEQYKDRTAVVTGASSGIGAAIAMDLVKAGMIVVGLARRVDKIEALKKDLPEELRENLYGMYCDVCDEGDTVWTFDLIDAKFDGIDVLINCAGVFRETSLIDKDNSGPIREVMNTNVIGLIICTREAFNSMEKHERNSHVVHINSIAGHQIPFNMQQSSHNIYPASKHAVTTITEIHRQEFIRSKRHIKVTSISPGAVETEIVPGDYRERYGEIPFLQPEDISKSVLYILGTPPHVQIHELIIKPFGERF